MSASPGPGGLTRRSTRCARRDIVRAVVADRSGALLRTQVFVDGRWIEADDRRDVRGREPRDRRHDRGRAEARCRGDAAGHRGGRHGRWRRGAPGVRRTGHASCCGLATAMAEREDELAALMVLEQGKPLAEARGGDLLRAVLLRAVRRGGERLDGNDIPARARQARPRDARAVGVTAGITPWNFPPRWSRASPRPRSPSVHDGAQARRADAALGARRRGSRRGGRASPQASCRSSPGAVEYAPAIGRAMTSNPSSASSASPARPRSGSC